MTAGTINVSREIFHHSFFKQEPFTEREAWMWLIMEARWKAGKVRAGDFVVDLDRGQCAASVRFMASVWSWTPAKAQRFVERLKKMEMIRVKTDTGVSVITICNYDKFQNGKETADTGPIQDRYRTDTNKKKDAIRMEEGISEAKASYALSPRPSRFEEFWSVYPHRGGAKKGRAPAEISYTRAIKAGASEQDIIDGAKRSALDRQVRAGYARLPATWLNQKGWEDEIDVSVGQGNGNGTFNGSAESSGDRQLRLISIAARSL